MQVHAITKKAKSGYKAKPLVISVQNSHRKKTLVIACTNMAADSDSARNTFGKHFQRSSESMSIKTKHDGFDSSMIEMRNEDWRAFMDELTTY